MLESVLALLFITFLLVVSLRVVRQVTTKTLLDHAAARAARARSVGLNDFMCVKSARVAMIPSAGKRLTPADEALELYRIPQYLASENPSMAGGILDYQWWDTADLSLSEGAGVAPDVAAVMRLETNEMVIEGSAEIESHYPLYMGGF